MNRLPRSSSTQTANNNMKKPLGKAHSSTNWRMRTTTASSPSQDRHLEIRGQRGRQMTGVPQPKSRFISSQQATVPSPPALADLLQDPSSPAVDDGRRIYLASLLYAAKPSDIESFFAENGYKVNRVDMSIDPFSGRNPSYCFVNLPSKEQADLAIVSLNGQPFLGRPIKVKPAVHKSSRQGPSYYGKRFAGQPQNAYDSSESTLPTFDRWERSRTAVRWAENPWPGKRLYVGGLPRMAHQAAVDAEVRELFGAFKIEAVSKMKSPHESKREEPGNSFYLFVDFPNHEEAEAACKAMDGVEPKWGGKLRVDHVRTDQQRPNRDLSRKEGGIGIKTESDDDLGKYS